MADIKALKSYLVSLGFSVNQSQLTQFNNALKSATALVETSGGIQAAAFAKLGAAGVGAFTAIGAAAIATADRIAMADQEFRLFGERMFMDVQHARALKMTMDALGTTDLAALAFDPELNRRAQELLALQATLGKQLGPNFENAMEGIRDVRFEFSKFSIEVQYFIMNVLGQVFKGLGGESFLDRLRALNAYIVEHIPEWSRFIAEDIVPILKDTWRIISDIAEIVATVFDNIVGFLSGDTTLMGAANFDKFARSIGKVAHFLAWVLDLLLKVARVATDVFSGNFKGAFSDVAGGGGAGAGASVGGGSIQANDVRTLAQQVGARLGVPPEIIFGQWMHETGNLSNRGARELNNLAGIRLPGSTEYRQFGSLSDFGNYYTSLIQRRYSGALGAQTPEAYVGALKHGGYFEDAQSNYLRGVRGGMSRYGSGVSIGSINIMQPNATPKEIVDEIDKRTGTAAAYQTNEFASAY